MTTGPSGTPTGLATVTAAPPQQTTDPVYRSLQRVEFPDGRQGTFASEAPLPAGAPMTFDAALLDRPPGFNVGGILVHFLVPVAWRPDPTQGSVRAPGRGAARTYAGRGAWIGALVGAGIGFVLSVIMMANAYQTAAAETSFGHPQIDIGKAVVMFVITVGFLSALGAGIGAAGGALKRR